MGSLMDQMFQSRLGRVLDLSHSMAETSNKGLSFRHQSPRHGGSGCNIRSSLCSLPKGHSPLQDRLRLSGHLCIEPALSLLDVSSQGCTQAHGYDFQSSAVCFQVGVTSSLHAFSVKRNL